MLWEWLMQPVDLSRTHDIGFYVSWHGRLMVFAWGVCVPLAVFIARFFKILPWQDWPRELDNPTWWRSHLRLQTVTIVLSAVGLLMILAANQSKQDSSLHVILGYSVLALAGMQVLSGLFRGSKGGPTAPAADGSLAGDHYNMSHRRILFEMLHKSMGYIALLAGLVTIFLGLWIANAPHWMWLSLVLWLGLLIALSIFLQLRYGSYETYQAIWGPDQRHPGNLLPSNGWGMTRPGHATKVWSKRRNQ